MSKELKKDITVVLSWEWADELFGWYGRIFKLYIETLTNKSRIENDFIERYNYVKNKDLESFLSNDVLNKIKKEKYTETIFNDYFKKIEKLKIEDKIPYIFEKLHLPWLLERVDITTMATWVEARVPFVDHKLVEFVNSIPFKYKIKWKEWYDNKKAIEEWLLSKDISENLDITKYLLRKISEKYLPREIIERKKVWFPVPLDNWFKWNFKKYAEEILLDNKTLKRWIYDKEYLLSKKWLEELSWINIWMMINLELFIRKYFD
jgi:asparagine synthase (glutamine-hydrolysing)